MIFIDALGKIVVIAFAAAGAAEFFRWLLFLFLKPQNRIKAILSIDLSGSPEDAEYIIRSALSRLKWLQGKRNDSILYIEGELCDETRFICEKLAEKNPVIHIKE